MSVIVTGTEMPKSCGECLLCIYTADEKRAIGYCHTSDEDYYCKALDRFMEYDIVDGGFDILGKADDCPLCSLDSGEISDGYHTFNSLYHQRAVLFAAIVRAYRDRAWKSRRHQDGEFPFGRDDYFIVGIDTPEGSYTYHYQAEYWDMFDCEELPVGKEWDGHTDKDVTRLLSL